MCIRDSLATALATTPPKARAECNRWLCVLAVDTDARKPTVCHLAGSQRWGTQAAAFSTAAAMAREGTSGQVVGLNDTAPYAAAQGLGSSACGFGLTVAGDKVLMTLAPLVKRHVVVEMTASEAEGLAAGLGGR
jgi:hypothetical protein